MQETQINSKITYVSRRGFEVSQERFAELVSLYLDGVSSKDELELLADIVQSDLRAQVVFRQACRLHLATCRMFGKSDVRLQALPVVSYAHRTYRKAAVEGSLVAAFMIMCVVLFRLSESRMSQYNAQQQHAPEIPAFDSASIGVANSYVSSGDSCSILYISK